MLADSQVTRPRPDCGSFSPPFPGERQLPHYSFEILIEKESEGEGYYAYSPTLPGCFGNGKTIEEAKRSMRLAVSQHIDALLARGEVIPQNERLVHVEELAVGVPA